MIPVPPPPPPLPEEEEEEIAERKHVRSRPSLKTLKRVRKTRVSHTDVPMSNPFRKLSGMSTASGKSLFGSMNFLQDKESTSLAHKGYRLHEAGYYVAANKLCKLIDPSSRTIQITGGTVVCQKGMINYRPEGNNKVILQKMKSRWAVMKEGTIKLHNASMPPEYMDDEPPEEFLYENETLYVQHIRALKIKDVSSKTFTMVYWRKPRSSWRERAGNSLMNLTMSRKSVGKNKDGSTMKRLSRRRSSNNFSIRRKDRDASSSSLTSKKSSGSTLKRGLSFKNLVTRRSSQSFADSDSDDSDDETDNDQPDEVEDEEKKRQRENIESDYVEEKITFSFETVEDTKRWIRSLLLMIENQAIVFDAYADIMSKNEKAMSEDEKQRTAVEALRRHAVDLWALAKGQDSEKVESARLRLGKFLELEGKVIEADHWLDMALDRQSVEKNFGEIFYQLSEFLENKTSDPDEEARRLQEKYANSKIAKYLYKRYKAVPMGWEHYLAEQSVSSPLYRFQHELDDLKEQDYFLDI